MGEGIEASELFAIIDDAFSGIRTDASDEKQFGSVAAVEVEDCVFFGAFREAESDGVSPEGVSDAERVVLELSDSFPFGSSHRVGDTEGVISLFSFGCPLYISE